jgi:hypothetical protein
MRLTTGGFPVNGSGEDPSDTEPAATRELTGDQAVDDVLGHLDQAANEPLDKQIEVGERVQRVLQSRLADLGQE